MLSVCSACVTCRCESGCVCDESRFNGHTYDQTSLLVLHSLYVSQADECVLAIKVRHLPVVGGALCMLHMLCCKHPPRCRACRYWTARTRRQVSTR